MASRLCSSAGWLSFSTLNDAWIGPWRLLALDRRREILAENPRMAGRHAEKRQRRSLRGPSPLLPITKRVYADCECFRECALGQPDETTQRDYVVTTGDAPSEDAITLRPRNAACEVLCG